MPVGEYDKIRVSNAVVFPRMFFPAYLGKRIRKKQQKEGVGMR